MELKNCQKMIHNLAVGWYLRTGIDSDEFEAEGWFSYTKAKKNWQPDKPFKPYLYSIAWADMRAYAKKFKTSISIMENFSAHYSDPEKNAIFQNSVENLSPNSQTIVKLVFNNPVKMVKIAQSSQRHVKITKSTISKYLCEKGWKCSIINECFNEIATIWK